MIDEKKINSPKNKYIIIGIMLTLAIGIISFMPILIRNKGQYMDFGDYYQQYIPFIKELKRMLLSGNLSWSWNSFLGDDFVRGYSYYTIFNPFAWFVLLFPNDMILYGTLIATLIKLVVSTLSALFYIRLFCKEDKYALVGAIMYTFSGFTLVNLYFYFFLDIIAIFPLLMYGLEILIRKRIHKVYIISLALNAAINIYFFVSTVFLVIIYLFFRLEIYNFDEWKNKWLLIFDIFLSSVLGVGIVSIAIIPSLLSILASGKAAENIASKIAYIYFPSNFIEHIKTFMIPSESACYHAFYDSSSWSSTGMYLPVFGIVLVVQRFIRKNRDWITKLCILLSLLYLFPVTNGLFNLFSNLNYTRWLYCLVLLFSLVSALEIEDIVSDDSIINRKVLIVITAISAILCLFPTTIYILYRNGIYLLNFIANVCVTDLFIGYKRMVILQFITFINYLLMWIVLKNRQITKKFIILIICLGSAINFGVFNEINYDLNQTKYNTKQFYDKSIEVQVNNSNNFQHRIDYPNIIYNYGLFRNLPSVNYFNSLQNFKSSKFAERVGICGNVGATILTTPKKNGQYTDTLLSVKYYYDYDGSTKIPEGFKFYKTENNVDIYKNLNYIPMGFTYDSYCLEGDIKNLSKTDKSITLLNTMVIPKNEEKEVSKYLSKFDIVNVDKNLTKLSSDRNKITCDSFNGDSSGFKASINLESANLVFFSIPNDKDWEIKVNGKVVDPIEVNYGLMAIECDKGTNKIIATYHNKGLKIGIIGSAIFVVICLIIFIFKKIRFN